MNDTVTKLMGLADEYSLARQSLRVTEAIDARQALQDELTKVCADAAAYHALNAELDKQMAAKPDNY